MIVLSNTYDSACVRWITENVPTGIEIVDWYRDRDAWVANGGTVQVSAFPSVVHRDGSVQRLPETWTEVIAYDETIPTDPLTDTVRPPEWNVRVSRIVAPNDSGDVQP